MATGKRSKPTHPPYKQIIKEALEHEKRQGKSLAALKKYCAEKYGDALSSHWEKNLSRSIKAMETEGEVARHSKHTAHFILHSGSAGKKATGKGAKKGGKKAHAEGEEEEGLEVHEEEEEMEPEAGEEEEEEALPVEAGEEEEEMEGGEEEMEEEEEEAAAAAPKKKGGAKGKAAGGAKGGKNPKRQAAGKKGAAAKKAKGK